MAHLILLLEKYFAANAIPMPHFIARTERRMAVPSCYDVRIIIVFGQMNVLLVFFPA